MSYPTDGGCLCGAIRYRLSAAPMASMHCHCNNCRKASGAAMLTWVTVAADAVELVRGQPRRYGYVSEHYAGEVERWFCGSCGSQLAWHQVGSDTIDLTAGSLDDADRIEPGHHVFVRSRVRWLHGVDDLPAFETTS